MQKPKAPTGYNTINPFIITQDALKLITFLEKVFDAKEEPSAHTVDTDDLLLHSELKIGDATVMIAESKPGWPHTPSLLQVYVDDVAKTLKTAESLGAHIVTKPTDFYGELLSRFEDPFGNLWWVYQHGEEQSWDAEEATDDSEASWDAAPSEELTYIHDTLLDGMKNLGKHTK